MALTYLVQRFFYRLIEFLRHWYVKSIRIYSNFVLDKLERLDYYLAWKITLKNLFKPLYKDYTFLGFILGFIFRLIRLFIGGFIYGAVFLMAVAFYLVWLLLPVVLIFKVLAQ